MSCYSNYNVSFPEFINALCIPSTESQGHTMICLVKNILSLYYISSSSMLLPELRLFFILFLESNKEEHLRYVSSDGMVAF